MNWLYLPNSHQYTEIINVEKKDIFAKIKAIVNDLRILQSYYIGFLIPFFRQYKQWRMTMICKNCKFEVQDDSNVCDKCDAEVPKEAKCPNIINDVVCGTLICSNESVCSNCEWSITEKAFETGTRMCYAFKDEMPCQNLVAQGEVCSKCESITEPVLKTGRLLS